MSAHGKIRWSYSLKDSERVAYGLLGGRPRLIQPQLFPCSAQSLSSRDEAVFLLHIAAEIEHSLMVQYLYAMFSFGAPDALPDDQKKWYTSLRDIAKQEMGHLITVQNLALALGGPITFERQDYPFRSEFYPFPFTLERPTRDVFAKYVIAEMPPLESISSPQVRLLVEEAMVRSEIIDGGVAINRVGALYAKLIDLVGTLADVDFNFGTVKTFQASPKEISQTSGPGVPDPMDSIMTWPIDSRSTALCALKLIAAQGEGPVHSAAHSHFEQFLCIYRDFPETNPLFGEVFANPTRPVPTNPDTDGSDCFNPNRITDPICLALASFANLRYRLILDGLAHYLLVDRTSRPACKLILASFCTFEMKNTLAPVAVALTSLNRQLPPILEDGIPAVGGIPFELPYALSLSPDEASRWLAHIDVLRHSGLIAQQLIDSMDVPEAIRKLLNAILAIDAGTILQMQNAAADPSKDCPLS
jgi:Ferritin-like